VLFPENTEKFPRRPAQWQHSDSQTTGGRFSSRQDKRKSKSPRRSKWAGMHRLGPAAIWRGSAYTGQGVKGLKKAGKENTIEASASVGNPPTIQKVAHVSTEEGEKHALPDSGRRGQSKIQDRQKGGWACIVCVKRQVTKLGFQSSIENCPDKSQRWER